MPRTLIAYSTVDGYTLTICARLKRSLEGRGHVAELLEIGKAAEVNLTSFDRIVIGASIRYGRHRPAVYAFIDTHRDAIERIPSAFFSVNVVARKCGKDTPETNPYIKAFRRKTTWRPRAVAVFAGKLDYPRYGLLDRQVIRLIMWLTNGPTDPATCVEFTDWQAVDRFAHVVANMGSVVPTGAGQCCAVANATGEV
jgi:menaquinone-dependent protoporphyrinogen oxidase